MSSQAYAPVRQDDDDDELDHGMHHQDNSLGVTEDNDLEQQQHQLHHRNNGGGGGGGSQDGENDDENDENELSRRSLLEQDRQIMKERYENELLSNSSYCPFGFSAICLCITMAIACLIMFTVGMIILIVQKRNFDLRQRYDERPIVILANLNGLSYDFVKKDKTPTLFSWKSKILETKLTPVFPTLDAPNQYTLATGQIPKVHGVVGDSMLVVDADDPSKNKVINLRDTLSNVDDAQLLFSHLEQRTTAGAVRPIWSVAKDANITTMAISWIGANYASTAPGANKKPDTVNNQLKSNMDRVSEVRKALSKTKDKRPRLILVNLDDTKNEARTKGYDAVARDIDKAVGHLIQTVEDLKYLIPNVHLVLVSDHGLHTATNNDLEGKVKETLKELLLDKEPTIVSYNTGFIQITFSTPDDLEAALNKFNGLDYVEACSPSASLDSEWACTDIDKDLDFAPDSFAPNTMLLQAEPGFVFYDGELPKVSSGYLPSESSMKGLLLGMGKRFRTNALMDEVPNAGIYSLVGELLRIEGMKNDDGLLKDE